MFYFDPDPIEEEDNSLTREHQKLVRLLCLWLENLEGSAFWGFVPDEMKIWWENQKKRDIEQKEHERRVRQCEIDRIRKRVKADKERIRQLQGEDNEDAL